MTTAQKQAERAGELHEVAEQLHGVADQLRGVKTKQDRNGWLLIGVAGEGVLLIAALVIIGFLVQPIIRTANTVQDVAGPAAQKRGAAQTQGFLAFFLCTQRENTSEARVMDGKDPLPLRDGCPAYNFDPHRPIIAPSATTTTTPKRKTPRPATSTTGRPSTTATTSTTRAVTATTTCPTVQLGGTCVTVPRK